ncbi:MAG: YciI family protein [Pseudonocardia sp.]|nr:YciI family protein [Pseudonocardia sp.]
MARYLLNIIQPDEGQPEPEVLEPIMAELAVLNQDMRDAGAFVFTVGLHPATTATVVHARGADVLITDGPFAEGKEHVGGFWIVESPDLDAALGWAGRATRILELPIEVRPVAG